MNLLIFAFILVAVVAFILIGFPLFSFFSSKRLYSEAEIDFCSYLKMKFLRVPPQMTAEVFCSMKDAGILVNLEQLQAHFLSGGDLNLIAKSLIAAKNAGVTLDFQEAAAMDLGAKEKLEIEIQKRISKAKKRPESEKT